jgi:hypothetical protein
MPSELMVDLCSLHIYLGFLKVHALIDMDLQNPKPKFGNFWNVNTTQRFAFNSLRPHEGSFKAYHKSQNLSSEV